MENLGGWLFWSVTGLVVYSGVSATVRYLQHWRSGARTLAAQAVLQTLFCMILLVALMFIYQGFMPD